MLCLQLVQLLPSDICGKTECWECINFRNPDPSYSLWLTIYYSQYFFCSKFISSFVRFSIPIFFLSFAEFFFLTFSFVRIHLSPFFFLDFFLHQLGFPPFFLFSFPFFLEFLILFPVCFFPFPSHSFLDSSNVLSLTYNKIKKIQETHTQPINTIWRLYTKMTRILSYILLDYWIVQDIPFFKSILTTWILASQIEILQALMKKKYQRDSLCGPNKAVRTVRWRKYHDKHKK